LTLRAARVRLFSEFFKTSPGVFNVKILRVSLLLLASQLAFSEQFRQTTPGRGAATARRRVLQGPEDGR